MTSVAELRSIAAEASGAALPRLAVIVPTLNERDNVVPLIRALDRALVGQGAEIVFVDDWSEDGTGEVIARIARWRSDIRLIRRHGRRGLASAVIDGVLSTTAPIVAVIDADMQHDESVLPAMVDAVRNGADVAVGTRYADGGSTGSWSAARVGGSRLATGLARLALGVKVSDPLSGFFVARQSLVAELVPSLSDRGFKILLDLLSASPRRLDVREVPYTFRSRNMGESKLGASVVADYLRLLARRGARRLFSERALRFALVGASGVAVNLALLRLLLVPLGFPAAEALAVAGAILSNFLLNNAITFGDRPLARRNLLRGLAGFYAVCGIGALASVALSTGAFAAGAPWWFAGGVGAATGAVWNFLVSSVLVWRQPLAVSAEQA